MPADERTGSRLWIDMTEAMMTATTGTLDVVVLQQVQDILPVEAKRFDMRWWASPSASPICTKHGCNTTLCIGGWAAWLKGYIRITSGSGFGVTPLGRRYVGQGRSVFAAAIGAPPDIARELFHVGYWPPDLRDRYARAAARYDHRVMARVGVEAITRFIDKHADLI